MPQLREPEGHDNMIDAHMHYGDESPELMEFLEEHDLKFLNICLAETGDANWHRQIELYGALARRHPKRFAWCTTFPLPEATEDKADYIDRVRAQLARDFSDGAVACKIWKNLGMEQRASDGDYLMPDDPVFDPIFDCIARHDRTLLCHIAEPLECWLPLDPDGVHFGYYSRNPEWHMHGKPGFPSHQRLMAARDEIIGKHPDLRIVGAHLGSLEYSLSELAARLDRYPNFAVDISARLGDLARHETTEAREFFIRYQDRLLFGLDVVLESPLSALATDARQQAVASLRDQYQTHWRFFEETGDMIVRGRPTKGFGLPEPTLRRFYEGNARRWYPGL